MRSIHSKLQVVELNIVILDILDYENKVSM